MLEQDIKDLAKKKNAVILAHYYQEDEIQDVADFIGDSLELSRKASETNANIIVFCGVKFMAEVAKILSPKKKVILPDKNAGCSLENSCKPEAFKYFRDKHPDHIAITYINSSAEVKSMSDIICTSSSAEKIINSLPVNQPVLFSPDKYLGSYLKKKTGRDMLLWEGTCVVHEQFSERDLVKLRVRHKEAFVIAHPECPESLLQYADHIGSTSSLLRYVKEKSNSEFIVLTESGIIHQMKKCSLGSKFYSVEGINSEGCVSCSKCPYMRLNTMEKLYKCLLNETPEIVMKQDLILSARKPLEKMLDLSI
ncbi:MAG: quinolinate synthase NadA [Rickettsiaceae bacterium H1]|nr:quinolinate synthase NadA [Rickettsiaceae bacterium H1]